MPVFAISSVPASETKDGGLHRQIDAQIETGFRSFDVDPATAVADKCNDAEFVRRIHLDLTGSIPDARTASRFQLDRAPDKRTKLIDQLLASDEFSVHMASVFDTMLMERRADSRVTTEEWRGYLRESFAADKPLDQLAREILVGGSATDDTLRPAAKFYLDRADEDALVRDTGRLFLGMDLQCAQCHDHPSIDDWKHQHYFGLSVFFGGSKIFKRADGKFVLQEAFTPTAEFASVFKPDVTHTTGPQIPFGKALMVPTFEKGDEYVDKDWKKKKLIPELRFSLRDLLAKELTAETSPAFTRNFANRLWGMMMGRGLVHPYDMDHSENPPSHPQLLDELSKSLRDMNYDPRLVTEEAYLAILTRAPIEDEIAAASAHLEVRGSDRPAAVTELLWSLVASAEFRLNH